jgi:Ribbon-helix-helix domain
MERVRLHIMIDQGQHAALQVASKRAGVSLSKLLDLGIADLLAKLERDQAVVVPLQPVAAQ